MHILATFVQEICGSNGCDAGETVLGSVFIIVIGFAAIAFFGVIR